MRIQKEWNAWAMRISMGRICVQPWRLRGSDPVGIGNWCWSRNLAEVLKTIRPRKALAIEPSQWAYSRLESMV